MTIWAIIGACGMGLLIGVLIYEVVTHRPFFDFLW